MRKKMTKTTRKIFALGVAVAILTSTITISSYSEDMTPTPSGKDITENVNIETALFSYYDNGEKKDITIIEDNEVVITEPVQLLYKEEYVLHYSWTIDDASPIIEKGDFFRLTLPEYLTPRLVVGENGYAPIFSDVDGVLIGYWRIVSEVVDGKNVSQIEFVAHSNFAAVIADRKGFFNLEGFIAWVDNEEQDVILKFPGIDIPANIENPEYTPPRHEQEGYGAGVARPDQMPNVAKNAAGKITPSTSGDGTGSVLWTVRFGYDDYVNTSHLRSDDTFDAHKNVVIRDEIFQEGHVFTDMSIRLPYFTPHNEEGVASAYWKASWTPRMGDLGIERYYEHDYGSTAEWEEAISAPENAPAYGISTNGKIAILNLGNILENGIKYAPDNASLEQMLRRDKLLTNEEVKTIMQSIGDNTSSYTLTEYDGTTENIAITSFLDNRTICYMVNFHSKMDMVNGRVYSNELTLSYDGISEDVKSINEVWMSTSDAGAGGTTTGILYLFKYDEDNYNTSEEKDIIGARFDLYKINDGTEEFISSETTDNVGSVSFERMAVGKYRIYETSSGGNHDTNSLTLYRRNEAGEYEPYVSDAVGNNWFDFEVTEEDRYFYFEATNRIEEKGAISITKTDADTPDAKLEGAEFKLEGTDGEGSFTSKFDEVNEVYMLSDLPYGTYTLTETKAPEGYDAESLLGIADVDLVMPGIQITIDSEATVSYAATNEVMEEGALPPSPSPGDPDPTNPTTEGSTDSALPMNEDEVPDTGDESPLQIYLATMLISFIGMTYAVIRREKNEFL